MAAYASNAGVAVKEATAASHASLAVSTEAAEAAYSEAETAATVESVAEAAEAAEAVAAAADSTAAAAAELVVAAAAAFWSFGSTGGRVRPPPVSHGGDPSASPEPWPADWGPGLIPSDEGAGGAFGGARPATRTPGIPGPDDRKTGAPRPPPAKRVDGAEPRFR